MSDLISRQALCEYALNQKDKSVTPNDIMRFPSAQPTEASCWGCNCPKMERLKEQKTFSEMVHLHDAESHDKRTETHARDLISRQDAIDAMTNTLWHYPNECYRNLNEYEFAKGLSELGLKSVPSAKPYTEAEIQKMQELEQAELQKAYECGRASAQPEIIRCKDCKHYEGGWYCSAWNNSPGFPIVTEKGYCNLAERRTDESD